MHKAQKVYLYFRVYQHYLIAHKLADDSSQITVNDLVDFVDHQIEEEEERAELIKFCLEAY